MPFTDRAEAGRRLAARLSEYAGGNDHVILGLPRGGLPVASAVAARLNAQLDTIVVRKVGVPGYQELAMGAVATGDVTNRNEDVLICLGIPLDVFEACANIQRHEVERLDKLYREGHPAPELHARSVVLVDDGLATGATMKAAIEAARKSKPRRLIVAVPVAARVAADEFRRMLQEPHERFICLNEPEALDGVGRWYDDFRQVTDDEVRELLTARGYEGRTK